MPTYNRRDLLERAIISVIGQDFDDWELIIIDDGSSDGTRQYVESIRNEKITYHYQENKGRSAARNKGLSLSAGVYICFLDSDDELLPSYLSTFRSIIAESNPKILLAGVYLQRKGMNTKIIPSKQKSDILIQILKGDFNLMPFCFQNETIIKVNFEESLFYGEDFQFLIPVLLENDLTSINTITSIVHDHNERTISKVFNTPDIAFKQFSTSILQTILKNEKRLEKLVGVKELKLLTKSKSENFIRTMARNDLSNAVKIKRELPNIGVNIFDLMFMRIKGFMANRIRLL